MTYYRVRGCSFPFYWDANNHNFSKTNFQRQRVGQAFRTDIQTLNGKIMLTRNELLAAYRGWLHSFKPNEFMTFNFGYPVSLEVGAGSVRHFFNCLQRGVYGRNWHKRRAKRSMIVGGFWEHLDSNPHLHAVVKISKKERQWLSKNGEELWLEIQTRGQLDFSEIKSRKKVISYITKEVAGPDSQERLFTYKAPLDSRNA
jgi:hypothetical protein